MGTAFVSHSLRHICSSTYYIDRLLVLAGCLVDLWAFEGVCSLLGSRGNNCSSRPAQLPGGSGRCGLAGINVLASGTSNHIGIAVKKAFSGSPMPCLLHSATDTACDCPRRFRFPLQRPPTVYFHLSSLLLWSCSIATAKLSVRFVNGFSQCVCWADFRV